MPTTTRSKSKNEPVGIVISRGQRDEPVPAFWAYVWGPVSESEIPVNESKAA